MQDSDEAPQRPFNIVPVCWLCRHYDEGHPEPYTCAGFPKRIPPKILAALHDHRRPYPGDRGFRFEPVSEEAAAYVEWVFPES